jgi:hypothetical protein
MGKHNLSFQLTCSGTNEWFSENGASKDLISPNLRLDTFNQFPLLSFYSQIF